MGSSRVTHYECRRRRCCCCCRHNSRQSRQVTSAMRITYKQTSRCRHCLRRCSVNSAQIVNAKLDKVKRRKTTKVYLLLLFKRIIKREKKKKHNALVEWTWVWVGASAGASCCWPRLPLRRGINVNKIIFRWLVDFGTFQRLQRIARHPLPFAVRRRRIEFSQAACELLCYNYTCASWL